MKHLQLNTKKFRNINFETGKLQQWATISSNHYRSQKRENIYLFFLALVSHTRFATEQNKRKTASNNISKRKSSLDVFWFNFAYFSSCQSDFLSISLLVPLSFNFTGRSWLWLPKTLPFSPASATLRYYSSELKSHK